MTSSFPSYSLTTLGLKKPGQVTAVYTPKDFELNRIMSDVVRIVERAHGASNV
jgi:hypothetical protein